MKALFSFWSLPAREHRGFPWVLHKASMFSWALAVAQARRHYSEVELVTDHDGLELLCNKMALPFTSANTELSSLPSSLSFLWALGKLKAYGLQSKPFIHLDGDVFLWKKPSCDDGEVFAQNFETFDAYFCRVESVLSRLGYCPDWMKEPQAIGTKPVNMGLFGANKLSFVKEYAALALEVATHPRNREPLFEIYRAIHHVTPSTVCEQWIVTALAKRLGQPIKCLFDEGACWNKEDANEAGYTHLLGASKQNIGVCKRLEARVQRDYPELWERVQAYA